MYYEVQGEYNVEGDEEEYLLGQLQALQARRGGMPFARPSSAPLARVPPRAIVTQSAPNQSRRLYLGFDSVATIATLASSTLTRRPTAIFRPEQLVVDPNVAANFIITSIQVGRKLQGLSTDAVSASTFSPDNALGALGFDTVQRTEEVSLVVTNTSAAPARFMATMIGTAVEAA